MPQHPNTIWINKNVEIKGNFLYGSTITIDNEEIEVSPKALERVVYFAAYIVMDPKDTGLMFKQILSEKEYNEAVVEMKKDSFIRDVLGEYYEPFMLMKTLRNQSPVQARMMDNFRIY